MAARRTASTHSRVGTQDVRASNSAAVLSALAHFPTPPSRADLAEATGLTRATVSRLVDSMIAAGIVEELEAPLSGARGRPGIPLTLKSGAVVALGLEVNVSYIAALLLDISGEVLDQVIIEGDFYASSPHPVLTELGSVAAKIMADVQTKALHVAGTSVALPGLVKDDRLVRAPNLRWEEVDVWETIDPMGSLGDHSTGNEGNYAALSYAYERPGVARHPLSFIYISGEVGIGGSIVLDSQPMLGDHGWAGEIGHICVDPEGPLCSCGSRGCLEAIVGHTALTNSVGLRSEATALDIFERLRAGSRKSKSVIQTAGAALGRAIADAVNVLDVHTVIFGGDLCVLLPVLESTIRVELDQRVIGPSEIELIAAADPVPHSSASRGGAINALNTVLANPAKILNF